LRSNGSIQANVDKMDSPSASCFIHHHPPAEARYQASPGSLGCKSIDESGFGGLADEKIEPVREAAPNIESKKNPSTTFDNISITRIPFINIWL